MRTPGLRRTLNRGFRVRDAQGKAFRVARIAQDIAERRDLERQVIEIVSYERRRICRELHDSLGQQLTGIGYLAKGLANRLADTSPHGMKTAEDILHGLQSASAELRRIVEGLAPVDFDGDGLTVGLQDLANTITSHSDMKCVFDCPRPIMVANKNIATQLYRIAQEATNNAVKHSGASCIRIGLQAADGTLKLNIRDDGNGIDRQSHDGNGMGLRIMQYRSHLIDGSFSIRSEVDGTTVMCSLVILSA